MQLLDPNPFDDRVSVYEEDDSDEPPVLEIPPDIPDLMSDDLGRLLGFFRDYCRIFVNRGRV